MDKRRARGDGLSTPRVEADNVQLLSGVVNGHTTGTAIALMIENQNTRSCLLYTSILWILQAAKPSKCKKSISSPFLGRSVIQ